MKWSLTIILPSEKNKRNKTHKTINRQINLKMRNHFTSVLPSLRPRAWGDTKRISNFTCNRWKEDTGSNLKRRNIHIGRYESLISNDTSSETEQQLSAPGWLDLFKKTSMASAAERLVILLLPFRIKFCPQEILLIIVFPLSLSKIIILFKCRMN